MNKLSLKKAQRTCPECNSTNIKLNPETNELVCQNCGLVIEDNSIDFGQDWRDFNNSQVNNNKRVGSPLTFTKHDMGASTKIGTGSDMQRLSSTERTHFYRIKKWQSRISTAIERNLKFALAELRRVSSFLNIPHMAEEEAARIYYMAAEKGLVRGRSMESVVAGALYAACRRHGAPRTLDEISQAFPLDKKEIGKTYRFICRQLKIRILPTSPVDYVYRFASELELSPMATSKATEILRKAKEKEIVSGKGPMGIAAAALYVAALLSDERKTQREVADVAGVTEVTIRNRYKELLEKLDLEDDIKKIKEK